MNIREPSWPSLVDRRRNDIVSNLRRSGRYQCGVHIATGDDRTRGGHRIPLLTSSIPDIPLIIMKCLQSPFQIRDLTCVN